jgi:ribosomal protein S18 acetylase RimI-like enzyme
MAVIEPLTRQHCLEIAQLHLSYLRTNFKGRPGLRLLQLYYLTVARGSGACGYVAQENGLTIGYVCGVWNPAELRAHLFKKRWPRLIFWGILQVIVSPKILVVLLHRFISGPGVWRPGGQRYELRPIVVTPSARGARVATQLLEALVADAASRGFEQLHLLTEEDNIAARKFYTKVGFVQTGLVSGSKKNYSVHTRSVKGGL